MQNTTCIPVKIREEIVLFKSCFRPWLSIIFSQNTTNVKTHGHKFSRTMNTNYIKK